MFITSHAAVGALLAEALPGHPFLAFLLAFAAHFLIDIIPHGDSTVYRGFISGTRVRRALAYVTIDSIVAIVFVLAIFNAGLYTDRSVTSWGILGSVLPDFLVAIHDVTKNKFLKRFHQLHFFFHNFIVSRKGDVKFASGFAVQMIFLAAVLSRLG